uniref:Large ribosomal subunit protein mL62 n=1 Tax=Elaeophora elaphi TaxID=1147741 RepID=A0A0R3RSE3_9BILA
MVQYFFVPFQSICFSKDDDGSDEFIGCIPVGLKLFAEKIEKRFMRSGGPGGQNVNMVNTKCQIRFNLNEADWLSPEIQEVFRKRFVRLVNKQDDVVISSDKSRIQAENQEECFKKLQAMLLECNKELLCNRSPTNQDKAIMDNRARKAAQRRLYAKRIQSEKKRSRDPYKSI